MTGFRLCENIGTLASVYGKTPEQFIKRLRESQNQRELDENEHEIDEYETSENSSGQAIGSYQGQAINQGTIQLSNNSLLTLIRIRTSHAK